MIKEVEPLPASLFYLPKKREKDSINCGLNLFEAMPKKRQRVDFETDEGSSGEEDGSEDERSDSAEEDDQLHEGKEIHLFEFKS